ncbi:hypothetical protein Tco_1057011 [Tanacetum coccineum]|uniref:Retrotransposon gag domain-containing protein n=1 Tax=Tanacetum coccineum TaxID=301880 RepID=A0ABQ5H4Y0_9ASTR
MMRDLWDPELPGIRPREHYKLPSPVNETEMCLRLFTHYRKRTPERLESLGYGITGYNGMTCRSHPGELATDTPRGVHQRVTELATTTIQERTALLMEERLDIFSCRLGTIDDGLLSGTFPRGISTSRLNSYTIMLSIPRSTELQQQDIPNTPWILIPLRPILGVLQNEIKKIEAELWNLKVKGTDVVAYNQRFQELTLLCDRMFPEETDKIERYVGGMPDLIYSSVVASKPKTMQEAIEACYFKINSTRYI